MIFKFVQEATERIFNNSFACIHEEHAVPEINRSQTQSIYLKYRIWFLFQCGTILFDCFSKFTNCNIYCTSSTEKVWNKFYTSIYTINKCL